MENEAKERTLGDGMDNALIALADCAKQFHLKLRSSEQILQSLKPVEPTGKVINLIPKYIPKIRKKPKYLTSKPKEPKFVPYEPFKAAINPIKPVKRVKKKELVKDKNNIDIHDLVVQMSEMRMAELNKAKMEALKGEEPLITRKQWVEEKTAYERDIKNLRESNSHLENQLKFQAQVNSELKTLLVAAVGEDLESRVQHLTQDKLQLARALLNSANHLTSHQEQTEWLSGQCEVWRSKFLASSLMVEELARWKSLLTKRMNDMQENLKGLIEERTKVRNYSINCYNSLTQISNSNNLDVVPLKTSNIVELSAANFKLCENVAQHVLKDVSKDIGHITKLPSNTFCESIAVQILKNPVSFISKPDLVCNAVMGAALSLGGGQIFLQHPHSHMSCCAHCKGEVQDI